MSDGKTVQYMDALIYRAKAFLYLIPGTHPTLNQPFKVIFHQDYYFFQM